MICQSRHQGLTYAAYSSGGASRPEERFHGLVYGNLGLVTSRTDALNQTETTEYDVAGKVARITTAKGRRRVSSTTSATA